MRVCRFFKVLKIGDWLHSHCWDEFPFFYFFLACHVRHHQCAGKPEATTLQSVLFYILYFSLSFILHAFGWHVSITVGVDKYWWLLHSHLTWKWKLVPYSHWGEKPDVSGCQWVFSPVWKMYKCNQTKATCLMEVLLEQKTTKRH